MDELPVFACNDCGLSFSVIANNDYLISHGEPFIVYCPRCGSEDLEPPEKTEE